MYATLIEILSANMSLISIFLATIPLLATIIALIFQLRTDTIQRREDLWIGLVTERNLIIKEIGNWNRNQGLTNLQNREVVYRMLHTYLDSLREIIMIEPKRRYILFRSPRHARLAHWYKAMRELYNRMYREFGNEIDILFHDELHPDPLICTKANCVKVKIIEGGVKEEKLKKLLCWKIVIKGGAATTS
jgi:hypothetical protein